MTTPIRTLNIVLCRGGALSKIVAYPATVEGEAQAVETFRSDLTAMGATEDDIAESMQTLHYEDGQGNDLYLRYST